MLLQRTFHIALFHGPMRNNAEHCVAVQEE